MGDATIPLLEDELPAADPLAGFSDWLAEASRRGIELPQRVCLASASRDGTPSARMVLFRGLDAGRFCFFTDYRSRKARELTDNPRAALVFHWHGLERQIRIEGGVTRLEDSASDRYFRSRRRESRISAWSSEQSAGVDSRDALEEAWRRVERRFEGRDVPRPDHWGGFALAAQRIEFWRGRADRFHDRLLYRRIDGGWERTRLQP